LRSEIIKEKGERVKVKVKAEVEAEVGKKVNINAKVLLND
jgi:hypothetical protein